MTNNSGPETEVWYRYEDKSYSVADEWGDHHHSDLQIQERTFPVVRHTPKGVVLRWSPFGGEIRVCHHWRKKFAAPTKREALEGLIARKEREASIHEARAGRARTFQKMAEERLSDLVMGDQKIFGRDQNYPS